ncbi:aminopeptidase NAALADL1-like [Pecten maximus]|uniref:aminopeptidase NAALADL1-like n=1 Tax=Pecten maximus TaxID=6579 RepID=UPI001458EA56|nr:aminopeptidase NAALADL1-like [Pecten maximus]
MATPKSPAKFRSWSSMDSIDPADIRRLYDPESSSKSSSVRCVSTWMFSLLILGSTVLFLIGLLVGYYVRESQNLDTDGSIAHCFYGERSDGFSQEQVDSAHENIMYLLSSENIKTLKREFTSSQTLNQDTTWDENTVNFVKSEFTKYGLDKVSIEEYDVVVTYPNPVQPNRLEVITSAGQVKLNLTFGVGQRSKVNRRKRAAEDVEETKDPPVLPYVAFAPSGTVQGVLVYGHYGRMVDLVLVNNTGVILKDKILLLRLGKISVAEKLSLAKQWGAVGVVLYLDPADLRGTEDRVISPDDDLQKFVPYASAGGKIYTANPNGVSMVTAQTVSMETAALLLSSMTGPSAPVSWNGRLNTSYHIQGQHMVRLIINNIKKVETVRNVVGVIEGDIEGDRNIMVGASRADGLQTDFDVSMGTINLLQLARSMASIRRLEKWLPRRGVKFYSWGGTQYSHTGIQEFLKANHVIVQTKAVAYIDLDLYMQQRDRLHTPSMDVTTSRLLSHLVEKVSNIVPNAAMSELSIKDSLSLTVNHYRKCVSATDYHHGSKDSLFFFQELGIPVFKAGFDLPSAMVNNGSLHDQEHHYRYHLAAARVMALVILNLVDDNILPLDVSALASSIDEALIQTADIPDINELIDKLLTSSDILVTTGKAFEVYIDSLGPSKVPLEARRVNDALMMLEKAFISPVIHRNSASVLYEIDDRGQLTVIKEMAALSTSTNDWSNFHCLLDTFSNALKQSISILQLS